VAAVVGMLAVASSAQAANGFIDGVTAGDISDSSAIIWARTTNAHTAKPGPITAEVDPVGHGRVSIRVLGLRSLKSNNNTVQTKVPRLRPGHTYRYRFCIEKRNRKPRCSDKGTFETAPKPGQRKTIRFAYSGDETGVAAPGQRKPFWGNFKAWRSVVGEHNDFNIDFGDTIYSDPEVPDVKTARTVKQKWAMYRKKLAVKNMRLVRERAGMYNHWDDHEFINDFSVPEFGRRLYDHSVRAFRDYMPVHYTKKTGIYRTKRWGKNLELFFLDERSFRSAKASFHGVCDNPSTPGSPDLAPTAPQNVRNAFGVLIPALENPVPQACLDKINSPNRTMLGASQYKVFVKAVKSSTAKWKVVMNEVPIQQFYALPYDRWEGYAYERIKLLNALEAAHVSHLVFLTTDTHASFANVIRDRTLAGDSAPSNAPATAPSDTPYSDFITGPVATKPFAQEIDDATGGTGNGILVERAFFKPPPPNGVGMECAKGDENSYAEVTVTSKKLKVEYKNQDGGPILDADGVTPCGPYVLTR
jgi:phosphodiesterase/alkaline phosphatase D-like protein